MRDIPESIQNSADWHWWVLYWPTGWQCTRCNAVSFNYIRPLKEDLVHGMKCSEMTLMTEVLSE